MATALVEIRCTPFLIGLCLVILAAVAPCPALSQQTGEGSVQPLPQGRTFGGQGYLWLSQFANPGILGALYQTPTFPYTGIYPLYPGNFVNVIRQEGIEAGPVVLHPHIGVAEMSTDNVLRTATKRSDFFTTVPPDSRHNYPLVADISW